jgi:putative SOS response-associated peptidase YedK
MRFQYEKGAAMCSEYNVKVKQEEIEAALGGSLRNIAEKTDWNKRIKFTNHAPIIEMIDGEPALIERVVPVHPFPNSRLSGVEREDSTDTPDDEKQIKRIYELPTWKKGFTENRCLAVVTSFLESVYWGEDAGSMMEFKIPDEKVFFIAAIAIKPNIPKTGKTDGFSLLTHSATKQMLKYHQRLVVALKPKDALAYIEGGKLDNAAKKFDFLIQHRYIGPLEVTKERTMAKGWEKRTDLQVAKLNREKSYLKTLRQEGVER